MYYNNTAKMIPYSKILIVIVLDWFNFENKTIFNQICNLIAEMLTPIQTLIIISQGRQLQYIFCN